MLAAVIVMMTAASDFSVAYLFKATKVLEQLTAREWLSMRTAAEWKAAVESRIMHIQVLARLGCQRLCRIAAQ